MNADYDSLLTIVQFLQKYVEFHFKKLRLTSDLETENVFTNCCTDIQPSRTEMLNKNSMLNNIPILSNPLKETGSDCAESFCSKVCASNWVPDDGLW